ncbi:MAG: nucleoid-associated protein [Pseudomonadales bacterium]|nr:nucleoid-associated protein [Pseudomonadales bacterium]
MAIEQLSTFEILRVDPESAAEVHQPVQGAAVDDRAESLMQNCKRYFVQRTSKRYGCFSDDIGENPLPALLKQYLDEQIPFHRFAEKLVERFVELLNEVAIGFHGHLLIAENMAEQHELYIMHLQLQSAFSINEQLEITETEYADLSKIGFAGRIQLDAWKQSESSSYLAISRHRGEKGLQDLIEKWMGFANTVDSTADTQEFMNVVEAYANEMPEEESQAYKSKVVEYCIDQDQQGEQVVYADLSAYLNDDKPEDFATFAAANLPEEKQAFIPDKAKIKKLVRFTGRDKELSLSFSSAQLGRDVQYNRETGELLLKKIPKGLLQQLNEHFANT